MQKSICNNCYRKKKCKVYEKTAIVISCDRYCYSDGNDDIQMELII